MRSILILDSNYMLTSGVKKLLSDKLDFLVNSVTGDGDVILKAIEEYKPDVVVLDEKFRQKNVLELLKPCRSEAQVRLVILNGDDNWIEVVQKQEFLIQDHTDLLTVLLRESEP